MQIRKLYAASGWWRILLFGALATLLIGSPVVPANAAVEKPQDVDNNLQQFDDGSFQLTASALFPSGTPIQGDVQGAVQLAPIATLRSMQNSTDLPFGRRRAGVVNIGRNIFVIGGLGPDATSNNTDRRQSNVYSTQVDLQNGALGNWQDDLPLPAVEHNTLSTDTSAPRSSMAVAAFETGPDSGYIYVVGGAVDVSGYGVSSYSVLRGTVANGHIQAWDPMPPIPDFGLGPDGLQQASAFIAKLPDGRAFLYVAGGVQVYLELGSTVTAPSKYILSAQLDSSSGAFVGDAWKPNPPALPLAGSVQGIWNTTITGGVYSSTDGLSTAAVFYVLGGQISDSQSSSEIYRVDVDLATGAPVVGNPSGAGTSNASLGAARSLHAAVQYNGSVYVTGGVRAGSITNSVLGSYIKPDSRFPEFAPSTYFISTETTGSPGMPQPRAEHGAIAIPHPASGQTGAGAYVYVIGGSSTTTSTSSAQKTVYRSELGNSSATDVSYPLEAWYISDPVPFALANANLKQIYWYTNQQKGGNIVIQFRTSKDNDCQTLGTRTQAQAPWQDTKAFSSDGLNSFPLTPIPANCFQYRVRMTPSNATTSNATPYLLRLGIVVEVPGATDLTVKEVTFNTPTSPAGMTITIHNENKLLVGEPTLAANFTTEGSFFVDVFIYPPGATAPETQPVPTGPGPYAALSIDVLRSEVQAGPNGTGYDFTFSIPSTRRVCDYNTIYNTPTCQPRQLGEFFQQPGQYTVFVVVDGADNVDEQPDGAGQAESNNVYKTTLTVTEPPTAAFYAYLPVLVGP